MLKVTMKLGMRVYYLIVAHLQVKVQEYAYASLSDLLGALSFTSMRNERNTLDSFFYLSLRRL